MFKCPITFHFYSQKLRIIKNATHSTTWRPKRELLEALLTSSQVEPRNCSLSCIFVYIHSLPWRPLSASTDLIKPVCGRGYHPPQTHPPHRINELYCRQYANVEEECGIILCGGKHPARQTADYILPPLISWLVVIELNLIKAVI